MMKWREANSERKKKLMLLMELWFWWSAATPAQNNDTMHNTLSTLFIILFEIRLCESEMHLCAVSNQNGKLEKRYIISNLKYQSGFMAIKRDAILPIKKNSVGVVSAMSRYKFDTRAVRMSMCTALRCQHEYTTKDRRSSHCIPVDANNARRKREVGRRRRRSRRRIISHAPNSSMLKPI